MSRAPGSTRGRLKSSKGRPLDALEILLDYKNKVLYLVWYLSIIFVQWNGEDLITFGWVTGIVVKMWRVSMVVVVEQRLDSYPLKVTQLFTQTQTTFTHSVTALQF